VADWPAGAVADAVAGDGCHVAVNLNGYTKGARGDGSDISEQAVLRRMQAADVAPSQVTYNTLVDGYVKAGAMGEARACMVAAADAGVTLDAWSHSSLIKGHVQRSDMAAAERALLEMQAVGVKPTFVTYSTLIDGYVRNGDLEAALRLVVDMAAAGEPPSAVTYNSLLRGFAADREVNALRRALQLLDDMQARDVAPAADTFNTLMSAAVEADDAPLAVELHKRMQAAGLAADGVTYTVLIQVRKGEERLPAWGKRVGPSVALTTHDDTQPTQSFAQSLFALSPLQAHSQLGQVSEAVSAFEALSRDRSAVMDLTAYNAMTDAFARAGDMTAAESMLQTACAFAKRMGVPPPVEAHGAVVAGYVRLKLVQPAVDTVRRFHASGGTPDVQMLDMLVDLCVRTGEYKTAMQAVRAMELLGTEVDKAKYKALVVGQMERQRQADAADGGGVQAAPRKYTAAAARQRERAQQRKDKNVQLERFKFWLGLPNAYYDS
jgi:leucine-rich PPR motif-containing protein